MQVAQTGPGATDGQILLPHLVFDDLVRFAAAYDLAGGALNADWIEAFYLRDQTPGLVAMRALFPVSAEQIAQACLDAPAYFARLRVQIARATDFVLELDRIDRRLSALLPTPVRMPVYFVIGGFRVGAVKTQAGLVVALEVYGRDADAPMDGVPGWLAALPYSWRDLPTILAHELAHAQQSPRPARANLLGRCLREGVAELLCSLLTDGKRVQSHLDGWALANWPQIWARFLAQKDGEAVGEWLFNGGTSGDWPADVGYWVGWQIARTYYEAASDRASALQELLSFTDPEAVLAPVAERLASLAPIA